MPCNEGLKLCKRNALKILQSASKDGLLDVLKEATRKDANSKDDDSMTPVLWASFEGHLEALRLLCGRGGDPDKCDQFGNTALHLASAKGHLRCVDFLVKFGVNIYALDIDKHCAKDLAAINNRDDILRYLDAATSNFEATERKKAKAMKEVAEKNCEKRIREYMKRQQKQDQELKSSASSTNGGKSGRMLSTIKQKIWSSQGNLHKVVKETSPSPTTGSVSSNGSVKFSELVQSGSDICGGSIVNRKEKKVSKMKACSGMDSSFKIGEIESDGRRTITSLNGVQRDSEVLYVGTFGSNEENGKRGKISGLFDVDESGNSDTDLICNKSAYGTLSRSFSQPDILADNESSDHLRSEMALQRPTGIFDRPMLGSIAFRRSVTAALSQLNNDTYTMEKITATQPSTRTNSMSSKLRSGKQRSFLNLTDSDTDEGEAFSDNDDDQDAAGGPIQRFLCVWGLEEYLSIFQKQQIDLDTLLLLTEADLKSLGLPLGPFRKLSFAIQERKNALANPGIIKDSHL